MRRPRIQAQSALSLTRTRPPVPQVNRIAGYQRARTASRIDSSMHTGGTSDMPWHIGGHRIHFGWGVIFAMLLAAAGGGFGGQPWTRLSASSPDGAVTLEYDRLWRMNAPTTLKLQVSDAPDGSLRVAVSRTYLEKVRIDWTIPEPHLVVGAENAVSYHFVGDPENPSTTVTFSVTPLVAGMLHAEIDIEGYRPVRFRQFIYP